MTSEQDRVVKVACERCRGVTNHGVRRTLSISGTHGDTWQGGFDWSETYEIVQCLGCETPSFRSWAWAEYYDSDEDIIVLVYPPRLPDLEDLVWEMQRVMPGKVKRLYDETRRALLANADILAAAGLRATVEAACVEAGMRDGNLEGRIDQLAARGILTSRQADYLHSHRFIGNDALHEFEPPKKSALVSAFNVLTHLVRVMYGLPDPPDRLNAARAARMTPAPQDTAVAEGADSADTEG